MDGLKKNFVEEIISSSRLVVISILFCVLGYSAVVLVFAQLLTPLTAAGSLIEDQQGQIIGSRLIAQKFSSPCYFWPRPSAVNYNAAASGGSNESPTSEALGARASQIVTQYTATTDKPLPAELASASGSGLDPHISEAAAIYQVSRIAKVRGVSEEVLERLIKRQSFIISRVFVAERLVNVLQLNLALDREGVSVCNGRSLAESVGVSESGAGRRFFGAAR